MKMMIHDLSEEDFRKIFPTDPENCTVVSDDGTYHQCIGCLSCWLKTPGECPMKDGFSRLPKALSATNELVLISRCVYGSVSPFIKNAIDRTIGYLVPTVELRDGDTHFRIRYPGRLQMSVHFYGTAEEDERKAATDYLALISRSLEASVASVQFHETIAGLKGTIL
jgi:multimeric flavodoxin WrbA